MIKINEQNHLSVGGCDTVALTKEYGTPLYVYDEEVLRENCNRYVSAMERNFGKNGLVLYAGKAMSCLQMVNLVNEEGMGLDVVSGGELYTAHKAGFPMEKICFHGNNKTKEELTMALSFGVGLVVVDGETELRLLSDLAKETGKTQKILLRIKPGVDAHTHDFIKTGQIDSKFGVAYETGEALSLIKQAISAENIEYMGIHCHIGSQIFDVDPFLEAASLMLSLIREVKDETGVDTKVLNLGGGFGIRYTEEDDPLPFETYIEATATHIKKEAETKNLSVPKILLEPGRSIVGEAAVALYTVGSVKEIPNIRTYVSVDGGMADNPRYMLYQAEYEFLLANRAGDEKTEVVTVAGRSCESGDLLGENVRLPRTTAGDILATLSSGAYQYSMASHYNRVPNPAVLFAKDGKARVVVKRETYEDIIKNDIL